MGVTSLVLGIISLLLSFLPIVGLAGIILAIIGLILGIVDCVQKKKKEEKRGVAISGIVCSSIAIAIIIVINSLLGFVVYKFVGNADGNTVREFVESIQELEETEGANINVDFNSLLKEKNI